MEKTKKFMKNGIILSLILSLFMGLSISSAFASETPADNNNGTSATVEDEYDEYLAEHDKYLTDEDRAYLNRDDEIFYKEILEANGLIEADNKLSEESRAFWKPEIIKSYKMEYIRIKECDKYLTDEDRAYLNRDDEIFYKEILEAEGLTEEKLGSRIGEENIAFWKAVMIMRDKGRYRRIQKELAVDKQTWNAEREKKEAEKKAKEKAEAEKKAKEKTTITKKPTVKKNARFAKKYRKAYLKNYRFVKKYEKSYKKVYKLSKRYKYKKSRNAKRLYKKDNRDYKRYVELYKKYNKAYKKYVKLYRIYR